MPRLAPVTSANFPLSENISSMEVWLNYDFTNAVTRPESLEGGGYFRQRVSLSHKCRERQRRRERNRNFEIAPCVDSRSNDRQLFEIHRPEIDLGWLLEHAQVHDDALAAHHLAHLECC